MAVVLTTKQMAKNSLQANKDHQSALKSYVERLEAELQKVDQLLSSAEVADEEDERELDVGGFLLVPGSKKAWSPLGPNDLLSQDSPFHEDAEKRSRYLSFTCTHPMKAKELDVLAEAVRTENSRKYAFEAQQRGEEPFLGGSNSSLADIETNMEGLDWERIAEKVSSVSSTPRTARECQIRWVGDRHPLINHASWSQTELARLKTLVFERQEGQVNWVNIAKELSTNRTPIDCMRHALHKRHHMWDTQSDNRLLDAVKVYGTDNWNLVARHLSKGATAQQCSSRFMRTLDPTLKRGTWTTEEDSLLRLAVTAYGNSWMEIAAVIPGRNNEQCRDRWLDRISPNLVKGRWTDEEDGKLLEAVRILGRTWGKVSERMGNGRTDKVCRLRYEALNKRQQLDPTSESSTSTASPDQVGEEHQGDRAAPKQRPHAKKVSTTAALEATDDDNAPPPLQSTRPKPKPRTKSKGKEKEVTSVAAGDIVMRTGQPPSEIMNNEQLAPPLRPKPKSRTKSKGKDKELVAEKVSSVQAEPEKDVADKGMLVMTGRDRNEDPLPDEHEADTTLEAATVAKKARGRGKGKAKEREASTKSITTAIGSKRRAAGDADTVLAPPTKKRMAAVARNILPDVIGDAGAPLGKKVILPEVHLATRTPMSSTVDESPTATPTVANIVAVPMKGKRRAKKTAGPIRKQPARGAIAKETAAGGSMAQNVAPAVREASPALSDLTELTENE